MTVAETASDLEARLDASRHDDLSQEHLGRARDYEEEFSAATDRLDEISVATEELSKAGRRPPAEEAVSVKKLARALSRINAKAADEPLSVVIKEMHALSRAVTTVTSGLTAWAALAWSRHAASASGPPVDESLVAQLERAGLAVTEIRTLIESADRELILVGGRRLPTDGDVDRLSLALVQRQRASDLLQQLLPPDVAPFIMAASNAGGAHLDLLTPEVLEFLERTDSATRYRIKLV